jgi:photosystem II stability/assembly factor-like uncharacterized protein
LVWAFADSGGWRSADGGESWQELPVEGPARRDEPEDGVGAVGLTALAQDPGDDRTYYAGAGSVHSSAATVLKSTDGGKSWKSAGRGLTGDRVHRLVAVAKGHLFAVVGAHGLYRTLDGGASWSRIGSGLPEAELRSLVADPTRPGRLYVASVEGLFRSLDGGLSWQRVSSDLEDEDVEAVVVSAAGEVFAGTFLGVVRSSDGGESWIDMRNGLPNTDVRALALGGEPQRLWVGTAGGGVWSIEAP